MAFAMAVSTHRSCYRWLKTGHTLEFGLGFGFRLGLGGDQIGSGNVGTLRANNKTSGPSWAARAEKLEP